ncbi:hypothetical protein [Salmonella phage SD-15_S21]|nr:hypothetical protein [Salmonella phage SD-15_S21]
MLQTRNELLKKQNGIDPIIKEPITKPVLDHYHYGNQHCRTSYTSHCTNCGC